MLDSWNNMCTPWFWWQSRHIKGSIMCASHFLSVCNRDYYLLALPSFDCVSSNGASTWRKLLLSLGSNIAHFLMLAKLVLIIEIRAVGGRYHPGSFCTSANIFRAAIPYRNFWRCWCLSENLNGAWLPSVLNEWSWFLNPNCGVVLLMIVWGGGRTRIVEHKPVVIHVIVYP